MFLRILKVFLIVVFARALASDVSGRPCTPPPPAACRQALAPEQAPAASGTALRVVGDQPLLRLMLAEWAGKLHSMLSIAADGSVSFNVFADQVAGDAGARLLYELVTAPEQVIFYVGTDSQAAAELFVSDCPRHPSHCVAAKFAGTQYAHGGGHVVGIRGRPLVPQPAGEAFAVVAFNTAARVQQTGTARQFAEVAVAEQAAGSGQQVPLAALFIHEAAEVLEFARQRKRGERFDYTAAHTAAIRREAEIRGQRRLSGGFAGGDLQITTPRVEGVRRWVAGRRSSSSLAAVGRAMVELFFGVGRCRTCCTATGNKQSHKHRR